MELKESGSLTLDTIKKDSLGIYYVQALYETLYLH